MLMIEPPADPSVLNGRHTALVAHLAWSHREDESSARTAPTSDFSFEAIIEPYDGASSQHIEAAMRHGIFEGIQDFNRNPWRSPGELPSECVSPVRLPYGKLAVMGFRALRNDARMTAHMTELEGMRSAIQVLSALSSALEIVSHIVWLGWAPGSGSSAFAERYARIRCLSHDEVGHGAALPFPHQDFPDLALRMEKLDLHAIARARTSFSP